MIAIGAALGADGTSGEAQIQQAFDVAILTAPAATRVGDRVVLAHELHLTNFAHRPLTLERLRVEDVRSNWTLLDLTGTALARATEQVGPARSYKLTVPPGGRVIVYVDAAVDRASKPAELRHVVSYVATGGGEPAHGTIEATVSVDNRSIPLLSPPLRGGYWAAIYDPSLERGHRRVVYAVGGRARIVGRFAVDWMRVGPETARSKDNGLGAEVLAVADGIVASMRDGVPEPAAGQPRPQVGMADATGNYVSIDIGDGRYAFYEHLLPGILVKPGQGVRRGQLIARLGSTGQAWRPHLHFHLADANSPLAAEGLPYLLEGAQVHGAYDSIAAFEAGEAWTRRSAPVKLTGFPAPNAVLSFPGPADH